MRVERTIAFIVAEVLVAEVLPPSGVYGTKVLVSGIRSAMRNAPKANGITTSAYVFTVTSAFKNWRPPMRSRDKTLRASAANV